MLGLLLYFSTYSICERGAQVWELLKLFKKCI